MVAERVALYNGHGWRMEGATMRRLAISLTAAVPLLLAGVGPVAADTIYPPAGTYRETQTFNLTCETVACDTFVYTQRWTYAIQYQDGARRVCAGAVTRTSIIDEVHEIGCSDTPGAFTFNKGGFIVGWADTAIELHSGGYLEGPYSRTVHVSAALALATPVERNNQASVYTDGGTGCTYRVNEKFQFSTVAGTLTFDGTTLPLNEAGQPQNTMIADYSKPLVKCPR
jgi:hypothetical protein